MPSASTTAWRSYGGPPSARRLAARLPQDVLSLQTELIELPRQMRHLSTHAPRKRLCLPLLASSCMYATRCRSWPRVPTCRATRKLQTDLGWLRDPLDAEQRRKLNQPRFAHKEAAFNTHSCWEAARLRNGAPQRGFLVLWQVSGCLDFSALACQLDLSCLTRSP